MQFLIMNVGKKSFVYEYASNRSLDKYLHCLSGLDFLHIYDIARHKEIESDSVYSIGSASIYTFGCVLVLFCHFGYNWLIQFMKSTFVYMYFLNGQNVQEFIGLLCVLIFFSYCVY